LWIMTTPFLLNTLGNTLSKNNVYTGHDFSAVFQ
jgi:hypothetical protein